MEHETSISNPVVFRRELLVFAGVWVETKQQPAQPCQPGPLAILLRTCRILGYLSMDQQVWQWGNNWLLLVARELCFVSPSVKHVSF